MPLYEYVCQECQHEQELLIRGGEQPVCESCGATRLAKLLSAPVAHSNSSSSSQECQLPPAGGCGTGCGCHPG